MDSVAIPIRRNVLGRSGAIPLAFPCVPSLDDYSCDMFVDFLCLFCVVLFVSVSGCFVLFLCFFLLHVYMFPFWMLSLLMLVFSDCHMCLCSMFQCLGLVLFVDYRMCLCSFFGCTGFQYLDCKS